MGGCRQSGRDDGVLGRRSGGGTEKGKEMKEFAGGSRVLSVVEALSGVQLKIFVSIYELP